MTSYPRCKKCGGQRIPQREIDAGLTVIELTCLQCGWMGDPPPMPPPEDTHQSRRRRGGGHLGPRTPLSFDPD